MLPISDIYRYASSASQVDVEIDGYPNFHHATSLPGHRRLLLEAGINRVAEIRSIDGVTRRPVIVLRSSPRTAGREANPWHDEFDVDHGHVRYYGDHKATTIGPVGVTPGNGSLLAAWELHAASSPADRSLAPPLLVFRGTSALLGGRLLRQGFVEFCGLAVIERLEYVVQQDATSKRTFPNLVLDLAIMDLADTGDELDARFLDDRRDASLTAEEALRHAPASWRRWVQQGRAAIPRVRRRVMSSRVRSAADQRPAPGSREAVVLNQIYTHFEGRKHAFEALSARVAASLLTRSGSTYREGWLTRAGGDGGMDFVGRLDLGSPEHNTPVVVLGQAKCVKPTTGISPDEVARLVARLRRGWLGVFVTTGVFSQQAQIEIIDDQYPVLLIAAGALVDEVLKLAGSQDNGDVAKFLDAISSDYESLVTARRPEEILAQ